MNEVGPITERQTVAHPSLYGVLPGQGLRLFAQRCTVCGLLSFPRQPYGCERCGAQGASLTPEDLAARGRLLSFATVHRHQGDDIDAPFIIGRIQLADGPCIRCTLAHESTAGLRAGRSVVGTLRHARAGAALQELQFRAEGI